MALTVGEFMLKRKKQEKGEAKAPSPYDIPEWGISLEDIGYQYQEPMTAAAALDVARSESKKEEPFVLDIDMGTAMTTPSMILPEEKKGVIGWTKDIAKAVLRAPQRATTSVALESTTAILELATKKKIEAKWKPETKFEKMLFGEEEIKGMFLRTEEAMEATQSSLVNIGFDPDFAAGSAMMLAPLFVSAMVGLDLTPLGATRKGIWKASSKIAKLKNSDEIIKTVKTIVKTDDASIKILSKQLTKISDPKKVKTAIDEFIKKSIKPAKATIPKAKSLGKDVSKVTAKGEPKLVSIGGQYLPNSFSKLAKEARSLIKNNILGAEKIARTQLDNKGITTTAELIAHYSDEAIKTTDKGIRASLNEKAAKIASEASSKLIEQSRSIQAASLMNRLTVEGQIEFAARTILKHNKKFPNKMIPELTGEQAAKIMREVEGIKKMVDKPGDFAKAIRVSKLKNMIQDLAPTNTVKKTISVWKAGLLTGLKTSGLNIFANLSHGVSEIAKDAPASAVDIIASIFTGKRTTGFTLKGVGKGGVQGVKRGWNYLKTGFDERNIKAKLDYQHISWGANKIWKALGKYTDFVFKTMGAEDQPFYYAAKARSFADQSSAAATNKGLKGTARKKFIQNLIETPTEQMQKYATLDAQTAVFQHETALGRAAKKIQEIPVVGEVVVPFGRTPSSVATQILNYSPAGIASTVYKNLVKGPFDQRIFSQGVGRGLTGTAVMGLGAYLFKQGKIVLAYPKTEKERELWKLEGKKPNSVKIGNKYVTIQAFGPAGNVLIIGGYIQQGFDSTGSPTEAAKEAFYGSAKTFTEQTFLDGMSNTMEAIVNPDRNAAYVAKNMLSSTIPTMSSDIARAFDPLERRTETLTDAMKRRIPGARKTLEPQISVLGEERARIGNAFDVLANPFRPSEEVSSILINEFRRLWNEGYKVSPTLLGDKKGYPEIMTPEENTELWKRSGEIANGKLKELLALDKYDDVSDEKKAKKIDEYVKKAKVIARAEMVIKLTARLTGEERKEKLSELKAGGLMTKEVYEKYKELR